MILLCDQFTPKEYVLLYLKMEESKISRIRDIFKPFLFSVFKNVFCQYCKEVKDLLLNKNLFLFM